ncbi:hypothetical protein BXZ70DRAFT_957878 [Cristinia sonorae]|uniref:DUF7729 domain-containing protein n=1 Tax=Cristinia sonorae TaxID=1940300 RepID=A0A8K0UHK7_9AGAR|nr:hypothetical protein BXZ70DRAFT_957878 [Cristinia sonorae]
MFTPPPSPLPWKTNAGPSSRADDKGESLFRDASPSPSPSPSSSSVTLASPSSSPAPDVSEKEPPKIELPPSQMEAKRRMGRRTTWTIIVVPLILLLITFTTRYLSHPVVLDVLSGDLPISWPIEHPWQSHNHKRQPDPAPQQTSNGGISFPSPTTTDSLPAPSSTPRPPSNDQPIPTVPSSKPTLPTPFPQPLDTTLSQNFSTQGCKDFFSNMTNTVPFRQCRPFSLLQRSSSEFIQAQSNLTLLNNIVWGTCNTDSSEDTCNSNMAWFRDTLQVQCATELTANNAMVLNTFRGLQAYGLMRDTACLVDQTTNAYCYVEAVRNTNPSDLYFYQLALGTNLPPNVVPSCSTCTKSVMQKFADAVDVPALAGTYNNAVQVANDACGAGYVQMARIGGAAGLKSLSGWSLALMSVVMAFVGML